MTKKYIYIALLVAFLVAVVAAYSRGKNRGDVVLVTNQPPTPGFDPGPYVQRLHDVWNVYFWQRDTQQIGQVLNSLMSMPDADLIATANAYRSKYKKSLVDVVSDFDTWSLYFADNIPERLKTRLEVLGAV
jgi:hypothetical protein